MLNVLIACEESQRTCVAFRERGFRAFSADIQSCSGGHPEWHIMGDVLPYLNGRCLFWTQNGDYHEINGRWDLIIAHPPCTYMSNAGACRMYPHKGQIDPERFQKAMQAKEFFLKFLEADCEHIAIENPVPLSVVGLPQYDQVIQPYEYGDPYTKKTCLWLKNLPKLEPTDIVKPVGGWVCGNSDIWKRQAKSGTVIGKEKSPKHRSKTFEGIANAFADQWGKYINEKN